MVYIYVIEILETFKKCNNGDENEEKLRVFTLMTKNDGDPTREVTIINKSNREIGNFVDLKIHCNVMPYLKSLSRIISTNTC